MTYPKKLSEVLNYLCSFSSELIKPTSHSKLCKIGLLVFLFLLNFQLKAQEVKWINTINGPYSDNIAYSLVDTDGSIYTSGSFSGTFDFDPGSGVENRTSIGGGDAFLLKLDADGNFIWVITLGGPSSDSGGYITLDDQQNVYFSFSYQAMTDIDPTANIIMSSNSGTRDFCLMKLNSDGDYLWHKLSQGPNDDEYLYEIKFDQDENIYISGIYYDTVDFDFSSGEFEMASNGTYDTFIMKLNSAGDFLWAKSIGGNFLDGPREMEVNMNGDIYISIQFHETVDFDPGTGVYELTSNGMTDAALLKLDGNGNFIWVVRFGGIYHDNIEALKLDGLGNIYLGGSFTGSADFDPGPGTSYLYSLGQSDMFLVKLDTAGNLVYHEQFGGSGDDELRDFEIAENGDFYCHGHFNGSVDFDLSTNTHILTSNGGMDNFIFIMDTDRNFKWAGSTGGSSSISSGHLTLTNCHNDFIIGGTFISPDADLDPTDSVQIYAANGQDGYMVYMSNQLDIPITINHNILSSSIASNHYQWLDCDNGYAQISGENSATYTASENGFYALEITNEYGCVDTSDCFEVKTIGISDFNLAASTILYPNPTNGEIHIAFQDYSKIQEVKVFNLVGEEIDMFKPESSEMTYNLDLSSGVYLFKVITTNQDQHSYRILKQ